MLEINHDELATMPARYKALLINSLSGFKSANLIGTQNKQGKNNLAIFSSVFHLGASPALVGFITRPNSVSRHTVEYIQQTQQYTINQVSEKFWREAHQTSARYSEDECEFNETGLTSTFIAGVKAPFVKESRLRYALKLQQVIPINLNGTQLVIGKVTHIFCDHNAVKNDGYIDIESLNTVTVSGLDSYHTSKRLSRLSYAKPHKLPINIPINGELAKTLSGDNQDLIKADK
jgi:flavin reductase (DIM6/NTAB) family NADH-FMN oxidoreductase RutF